MNLSVEEFHGLGIALNEATLLGFEVDPVRALAGATFSVLTLPEQVNSPDDSRVQFLFSPVGRVAASLRLGRWDDQSAEVVRFPVEELLSVVRTFGGLPIYGWEFFDVHESGFPRWSDRLSLDWRAEATDGVAHTISLFQEGNGRHLDLCVWFDGFVIRDANGQTISLADFIAGGRRWWDALYAGDSRAAGRGIHPIEGDK